MKTFDLDAYRINLYNKLGYGSKQIRDKFEVTVKGINTKKMEMVVIDTMIFFLYS